jgi:hypothetical protein
MTGPRYDVAGGAAERSRPRSLGRASERSPCGVDQRARRGRSHRRRSFTQRVFDERPRSRRRSRRRSSAGGRRERKSRRRLRSSQARRVARPRSRSNWPAGMPEKRPMILVRRRTSTNVCSSGFVLRCSPGHAAGVDHDEVGGEGVRERTGQKAPKGRRTGRRLVRLGERGALTVRWRQGPRRGESPCSGSCARTVFPATHDATSAGRSAGIHLAPAVPCVRQNA